jgi:hypothetical protein
MPRGSRGAERERPRLDRRLRVERQRDERLDDTGLPERASRRGVCVEHLPERALARLGVAQRAHGRGRVERREHKSDKPRDASDEHGPMIT